MWENVESIKIVQIIKSDLQSDIGYTDINLSNTITNVKSTYVSKT